MTRLLLATCLAAVLALPLSGCSRADQQSKPAAVTLTEEAVGHYCQMNVLDHAGPKAQMHLAGMNQPIWFAQVSNAIAYLHDPERTAEVKAVYVNDMGRARSWGEPGPDNWIDADGAVYVIGSRRMGGMETPEAVPFSTRELAEAFAGEQGGRIVNLADVPDAYVRSGPETAPMDGMAMSQPKG